MHIRISLLSDEIREDNAAEKLRMRHKRATTFRRTKGEPASHMTGIEKKAIRTRIMWYENTRIWHERKPRALRAWHESNALAQKHTFESTKMEQVDQLLLLQAAYLVDIKTVTKGVVAHVRGPATF